MSEPLSVGDKVVVKGGVYMDCRGEVVEVYPDWGEVEVELHEENIAAFFYYGELEKIDG